MCGTRRRERIDLWRHCKGSVRGALRDTIPPIPATLPAEREYYGFQKHSRRRFGTISRFSSAEQVARSPT